MKKFVAIYMGTPGLQDKTPPDQQTIAAGMAAWGKWMTDHAAMIVDSGGPLGKTKRAARDGITSIQNAITGYVIVQAESHEAAAALFKSHPHFAIFPGDSVEIMECLPIPGI